MNSPDRVIRAIQFTEPDKMPFEHTIFPGAFKRHRQQLVDFLNMYRMILGIKTFRCQSSSIVQKITCKNTMINRDLIGFGCLDIRPVKLRSERLGGDRAAV